MDKLLSFYKKGTPIEIGLKVAITVIAIWILVSFGRSVIDSFLDIFKDQSNKRTIREILDDTYPTDGSIEDEDFRSTARIIASRQYSAMAGLGTDVRNLIDPLEDLSGAELRLVYDEFGSKDGKDLFQWYKEELCSGGLCMMLEYVYHGDASEGCESYLDQCSPLEYMQGVWIKSGLPF